MVPLRERKTILVLESDPDAHPAFYQALASFAELRFYPTLDQLLADEHHYPTRVILLDTRILKETPSALVGDIVSLRGRDAIGLVTDEMEEDYITEFRRWGFLQSAVKQEPIVEEELRHFVDCVEDPYNGFGLIRYLSSTVMMYNSTVRTMREKNDTVEKVINHFATANFEVHELYDVRLILEETLNNSLFHAFRTPTGEEKYQISNFKELEPREQVRVEYGNNARMAGFSVTDNAGTLPINTIISKLERQINKEGLFDCSGRGLYLSRMLTTQFVINIEENRRTQLIALFDARRRLERPKPFVVNFIGTDTFSEWRLDLEFD